MKRRTLTVFSILVLTIGALSIQAQNPKSASGTVTSTDPSSITISSKGKTLTFATDPGTRITSKASASDDTLHMNDEVKVSYRELDGKLIANGINITRPAVPSLKPIGVPKAAKCQAERNALQNASKANKANARAALESCLQFAAAGKRP